MTGLDLIHRYLAKYLPVLLSIFIILLLLKFAINTWTTLDGGTPSMDAQRWIGVFYNFLNLLNSLLFAGIVLILLQLLRTIHDTCGKPADPV